MFAMSAEDKENNLTVTRSEMNDNKQLRLAMVSSGAVAYIQPPTYVPRKWQPINHVIFRNPGMPAPPALERGQLSRDRFRLQEMGFKVRGPAHGLSSLFGLNISVATDSC
jgi:hypothetical protein